MTLSLECCRSAIRKLTTYKGAMYGLSAKGTYGIILSEVIACLIKIV